MVGKVRVYSTHCVLWPGCLSPLLSITLRSGHLIMGTRNLQRGLEATVPHLSDRPFLWPFLADPCAILNLHRERNSRGIAINAPMIYKVPCIMVWMCAYPLPGHGGGGGGVGALDIKCFIFPVKWHWADRRVPFGAQKTWDFQGPTPSHLPK